MTKLIIRPAAEADIDAAADYYVREEDIELGQRFYEAVDQTLAVLLEQPRLGAVQEMAWRPTGRVSSVAGRAALQCAPGLLLD